jgi:transposase
LDDTFEGHRKLYNIIHQFLTDHPDATVFAAVESTGGYENNWFNALLKFQETLNVKNARLNPKGVNHHGKADLKRIITDKVSAKMIAEYIINHPDKISYQTEDYFYSIRRKWKFIKSLIKEKTKFKNQLESLLYNANPDILLYCENGFPQWVLKLLSLFPDAQTLASTSQDKLTQIPYITKERACELIERAKVSIASITDALTRDTIIHTAQEILRLQKLIDQQVRFITEHCVLPELDILTTFTGIGDFSGIGLLIEIGSVARFPSVKHLASFFGLHPKYKQSGDGTWGFRMSKEGRVEPRAILYMVAMNAIEHNPLIREIYIHNLKKGKNRMDAIGVCMHKILRIIYGMLKNSQAFNPEIDRQNREKSVNNNHPISENKNRRYQKPDEHAPVSRRQNKKRKEQELSQNGNANKYEINIPALSKY